MSARTDASGPHGSRDIGPPGARAVIGVLVFVLAATPWPAAAQGQAEANRPSTDQAQDKSWSFSDTDATFGLYRRLLVEPVEVDFPGASGADRALAARQFASLVRSRLGDSFVFASQAGPGVLRVTYTLVMTDEPVRGVALATRKFPLGMSTSAVWSLAGGPTRARTVFTAAQFTDSLSGKVLGAVVRRSALDPRAQRAPILQEALNAISEDFANQTVREMRAVGVRVAR